MTTPDSKFQAGLEIRRRVLGEDYVDNAFASATDFTRPFQELVTRFAWGEIWTRPGLDPKTRSLLNLAIMTALNRPTELKLHIRGALRNGVTQEEIQEVFLQTAAYCGMPAALDSFKIAQDLFTEEDC
ncbi:4-carboxymuconolactone decarboxylase [Alicyclobacillus sp. ALC3]|uniref:4-carboxymuconolactone decarboxylase n=1 Tax=Alicyclobacillus sp. ALC3 TaxID=2796143 RepID=UPI0023788D34|nr:4-carboxymuconolactone decarboxylase [Alicyclobacillus sp. ALC3]WDL96550.1 4-carboxymuconolactone decarboxylase [Alicyclobacillus sp. ALC3]